MCKKILILEEDLGYAARDIEIGAASQGESVTEPRNNLKEALELYFEKE